MIISNVTLAELEAALQEVNTKYSNNICWNRRPESLNRQGTRFRLTLRCVSSRGSGHRISWSWPRFIVRNLVYACWHVHGTFFDALPYAAVIIAGKRIIHPHDEWEDYNVGSRRYPLYASYACLCKRGY